MQDTLLKVKEDGNFKGKSRIEKMKFQNVHAQGRKTIMSKSNTPKGWDVVLKLLPQKSALIHRRLMN